MIMDSNRTMNLIRYLAVAVIFFIVGYVFRMQQPHIQQTDSLPNNAQALSIEQVGHNDTIAKDESNEVTVQASTTQEQNTEHVSPDEDIDISHFVNGEYQVLMQHSSFVSGAKNLATNSGYSDWSQSIEINLGGYLEEHYQASDITSECNANICLFKGHMSSFNKGNLSQDLMDDLPTAFPWWTEWGTHLAIIPNEEDSNDNIFYIVKHKVDL